MLFRLDPHFHRTTAPCCASLDVLANPNPTKVPLSPHFGIRPCWNSIGFTGAKVVEQVVAAIIAYTPIAGLTFLVSTTGAAFSSAGFGNVFREWCNEADMPKRCSSHGLRKAACRRLALPEPDETH